MPSSSPRPVPSDPRSRPVLRRAADLVRARDPGWERSRGSARALLAMVLGAGAAVALLGVGGRPLLLAALGGVVAMLGALTLPAAGTQPGRHVLRLALAAAASGAVAASLTPWTALGYVVFIVVMAAGAWATRWGPTGMATGMAAFMAHFFVLFLGSAPADVPWIVAVATLGGLGTVLAGIVLLPDRPAVQLRRCVPALVARASLVVDAAIALVAEDDDGRRERLLDRTVDVQELALQIDTLLDDGRARASVVDPDGLRGAVLVTEVLTDHLTWAVVSTTPGLTPTGRRDRAAALRRARVTRAADDAPPPTAMVPHLHDDGDDRAVEVLQRLAVAAEQVTGAARPTTRSDDPTGADAELTAGDTDDHDVTGPAGPGPSLRKTVQITLAGTLSLLLGLQLSAVYWYWAVIGAFIVVLSTPSRGAGIRKAIDRTIGTAIGVVVGLGLGTVLSGRASIELAAIATLLFAAFWVFQANYLWMMTLISVMVALLYDVMGILTPQVLTVRVTETALGAGVGGLVAFFVLPTSSRRTIDDAVDGLLEALDDVLAAVAEDRVDLPVTRALDRAVATVRETTAPLLTSAPTTIGTEVRAARLLARSVRFRTRTLVTAIQHNHRATGHSIGGDEAATRASLRAVRDAVTALRGHLADPPELPAELAAGFPRSDGEVGAILGAIDDRLVAYASARRIPLREPAATSPRRRDGPSSART